MEVSVYDDPNSIEVIDAVKVYGSKSKPNVILKKLNLTVARGSIFGLIGASGCGKTTLLSCILGMRDLDGGVIKVLGVRSRKGKLVGSHPKIGYMPQDVALIPELTVGETIKFFASVYLIKQEKFKRRFEALKIILELPPDNQLIADCSGGQMRRVSFAAAMIHEPELLILDEPTVGLDPILREKIWNFMLELTKTSKVSIIITTHYIDEAKQADCCGFMRNGILLAEDAPQNLMLKYECDTLESLFFDLASRHEKSRDFDYENYIDEIPLIQENFIENHEEKIPSRNINKKALKALIYKNSTQILQQPLGLMFVLFIPILTILFIHLAIGGTPKGLKIGIINHEISNYDQCLHSSAIRRPPMRDKICELQLASCRFLNEITDEIAIKKFYDNFDEAYKDARSGHLIALIEFSANFSQSEQKYLQNFAKNDEIAINDRQITVNLDHTNHQLTFLVKQQLLDAFERFSRKLMKDCKFPEATELSPVTFGEPIYGKSDDDFRKIVAPTMILVMLFYFGSSMTGGCLINERGNGFWNRTLLAGVKVMEIMLSHIIVNMVIFFIQFVEVVIFSSLIFEPQNFSSFFLIAIFLLQNGICGLLFGFCISCVCHDIADANIYITALVQPMMMVAGMFWPLEGMPKMFQFLSYASPFTYPSNSLRDIMTKHYGIEDMVIVVGLIVITAWNIFLFYLSYLLLRRSKYNRS